MFLFLQEDLSPEDDYSRTVAFISAYERAAGIPLVVPRGLNERAARRFRKIGKPWPVPGMVVEQSIPA